MNAKTKAILFIVVGLVIFVLGCVLGAVIAGKLNGAALGGAGSITGFLAGVLLRSGKPSNNGTMAGGQDKTVAQLQGQLEAALAGRRQLEERVTDLEKRGADLLAANTRLGDQYRELVESSNRIAAGAERVDAAAEESKRTGDDLAKLAGI